MPQNDAVSKAKSVLADADKFEKSADPTGAQKPQPIAMPEKPAVSAKAGAGLGAELGSKARNVAEYEKAVPKYHKGGTVKETGLAELEKGETVRTKEQEKSVEEKSAAPKKEKKASPEALMTSEDKGGKKDAKSEKKGKGGEFTQTVVDHHNMGGHHVHHKHKNNPDKDVHYAAQDLEGVKAGLDQHIGGGAGQMQEAPEPMPNAEQAQAAATPPPAAAGAMPQQV